MLALWEILLEAQDSPGGIPKSFVEEKKEEMRRAQMDVKPGAGGGRRGFSGAITMPEYETHRLLY